MIGTKYSSPAKSYVNSHHDVLEPPKSPHLKVNSSSTEFHGSCFSEIYCFRFPGKFILKAPSAFMCLLVSDVLQFSIFFQAKTKQPACLFTMIL